MSWAWNNHHQILDYGWNHLYLSVLPTLIGTLLSLPLARLANRRRVARGAILSVGGLLYAIPSLPLFVLLPSILGTTILDPINVEVALTLYALALMLRSSADALAAVDDDVRLSAIALGYNPWQRFFKVELPLAGPVILAGMRVVSVSTVSLVTVGSLIGVNSLGYFFIDGYQRDFPTEIWVGIIGTVLIALALDLALLSAGRIALPWTRHQRRPHARRRPLGAPRAIES